MEKLKNLLNEYEGSKKIYVKWNLGEHGKLFQGNFRNSDLRIISKSYGFIQWLVDNDKIDLDMIPNVFTSSAQDRDEVYYCMRDIKDFSILNEQYGKPTIECLLMILSIQDNPIEFLISILR